MNYSLGNMLSRGGVSKKPVISGFAYPEETLTSTRAAQWTIDGVPVSGQTGSTFVVPLLAYGRVVRCGSSDPVTVWKPWDIAGVVSVRVADRGVLNAVSPDVVATDGQTVRRWNGLVSNQPADQAVGVNQPIFRATGQSGNPSVEFDGSNDRFELSGSELNAFQNVGQGYLIVGCRDTNPTGGFTGHNLIVFSNNAGVTRLLIGSRGLGGNSFSAVARRLDVDAFTSATSPNNGNYNVLCAHGDWANGFVRLRVNGAVAASTALPSSGQTSNTPSLSATIGSNPPNDANFPGHLCCAIAVNQAVSATNLSRLERFAGLFGGLNIPLV
jgi:hypothetical protein